MIEKTKFEREEMIRKQLVELYPNMSEEDLSRRIESIMSTHDLCVRLTVPQYNKYRGKV